MDGYLIGVLALAITAVALFFGVKLYDRLRNREGDDGQEELFHRGR